MFGRVVFYYTTNLRFWGALDGIMGVVWGNFKVGLFLFSFKECEPQHTSSTHRVLKFFAVIRHPVSTHFGFKDSKIMIKSKSQD
jgi:hypothetical protein